MTAGGKRKGAGRKKLPADKKKSSKTITLSPEAWERIDARSAATGRSRNQTIANSIYSHTAPSDINTRESLVQRLGELAHRPHFNCEDDTWYGCPLSVSGCSDDRYPKDKCNCGADEHNAEVDKLLKELTNLL